LKYIDFLKEQLPKDWLITEELNINWNGNDTIGILKMQTGTKYEDSTVQPFQLMVLTADVLKVKEELEAFITVNQNQFFISEFVNYCKQYYYTPIVPTIATPTGNQLTHQVILTGTLIISENVSDIKEAYINGEKVKITTSAISYTTQPEAHVMPLKNTISAIAETSLKAASLTIQLTFINKNSQVCEKLRMLRRGKLAINTPFDIKLLFTDNDFAESHKCVCTSVSLNTENGALPVITAVFARGEQ
jgi:hypothetical protein